MADEKPLRPTRILSLGLPRTGSLSMAKAYSMLGLQDVWHGVPKTSAPEEWRIIGEAAKASFPSNPAYTGKPFTRADWDTVFGPCEAVTDIGAMFAKELIAAYPEAKVVLVHRDYEKWAKSMESIYKAMFGMIPDFIANVVEPTMGGVILGVGRDALLGWGGTNDVKELRRNQRELFEAHYRDIEKLMPEDRLLHYRMGDGWEPLCQFLDIPVPDVPFPHENESKVFLKMVTDGYKRTLSKFAVFIAQYAVPVVAVGAGIWVYQRW